MSKDENNNNNNEENSNNDPFSQIFEQLFGAGNNMGNTNDNNNESPQGQGFPMGFNLPGMEQFNLNDIQKMLGNFNIEDIQKMATNMPMDPQALQQMFQQFSGLFGGMMPGFDMNENNNSSTAQVDPVNWELAKRAALQNTNNSSTEISDSERKNVDEALKLADYWLNDATNFASNNRIGQAWTGKDWVENSFNVWKEMSKPVAINMSKALTQSIEEQLPEELRGMLAGSSGMINNLGGSLFGTQFGQAVGKLSQNVFSSTDLGIPMAKDSLALVPANIVEFSDGLDIPKEDIRLFLAVREAAHARLFHHAPWLRDTVLNDIANYAKGLRIDTAGIEELVADIDPMNPQEINAALNAGNFLAPLTSEQEAALDRIETTLALIEGWVDNVTKEATKQLSSASQIQENIRRRRAAGGPAEKAMSSLIGLELRPRRMRDAAKLWKTIEKSRGIEGRDALWSHPDLLPNAEDLDHPESYEDRDKYRKDSMHDIDEALDKLFAGDFDEPKADKDSAKKDDYKKNSKNDKDDNEDNE
ncbi:MAG: zinc-dependent metalloprotease [Micrococcaceae bacterium]